MTVPGDVQPGLGRVPALDGVRQVRLTSPRAVAVLVVVGVAAGLVGAGTTVLLHAVQHAAFDYGSGPFEPAVERASALRRVAVLALGGLVAGTGWWLLRARLDEQPGVERLLWSGGHRRALFPALDALLQVLVVGLGASLGREGAPRELSAVAGQLVAERAGLSADQVRLVVACAAGAGLAAVYDVPLGGAVFVLELLLASWAPRLVLPVAVVCGLATVVAWTAVPRGPLYRVPGAPLTTSLVVAALVGGPLLGLAGSGVVALAAVARRRTPRGWRLLPATLLAFVSVGGVSAAYPALLGNGRGPAELAFLGREPLLVLLALAALKPLVTCACLASGARGGLLTPALATGALAGGALGTLWGHVWSGAPVGTCAVLGAAAVLAATTQAPLTALVLTAELTGAPLHLLLPLGVAVAGATVTSRRVARASVYTRVRFRPVGPPSAG